MLSARSSTRSDGHSCSTSSGALPAELPPSATIPRSRMPHLRSRNTSSTVLIRSASATIATPLGPIRFCDRSRCSRLRLLSRITSVTATMLGRSTSVSSRRSSPGPKAIPLLLPWKEFSGPAPAPGEPGVSGTAKESTVSFGLKPVPAWMARSAMLSGMPALRAFRSSRSSRRFSSGSWPPRCATFLMVSAIAWNSLGRPCSRLFGSSSLATGSGQTRSDSASAAARWSPSR